jgi:hypothetical protein
LFVNNLGELRQQQIRLCDSLVRTYQTYWIFRSRRLEKRGLKVISFLGIAVPLVAGGIIRQFYLGKRPPDQFLFVVAAISVALPVLSLWSLVDRWADKAEIGRRAVEEARELLTALETMRPGSNGLYDDFKLAVLEHQSYFGRSPDDALDVSDWTKRRGLRKAQERYKSRCPDVRSVA